MSDDAAPQDANVETAGQKEVAKNIYLVSYPKIVFLYPSLIAAIVAAIITKVNGNDMADLVGALEGARARDGRPKAIVMRTTPGHGVPTLVNRERAHFVRVGDDEWDGLRTELEREHG